MKGRDEMTNDNETRMPEFTSNPNLKVAPEVYDRIDKMISTEVFHRPTLMRGYIQGALKVLYLALWEHDTFTEKDFDDFLDLVIHTPGERKEVREYMQGKCNTVMRSLTHEERDALRDFIKRKKIRDTGKEG